MSLLKAITYNEALVLLRKTILDNTKIPNELILNGDSLYGPDILKTVNRYVSESPDTQTTFIVFEFKEIDNDSYGVTSDDNDTMITLSPYGFYLKIYGDDCHMVSQKIASIFKSSYAVEMLQNSGIKILTTSNITSLNEFINGVRWPRCDLELDVLCRFDFDMLSPDQTGGYGEIVDDFARPIEIIKL